MITFIMANGNHSWLSLNAKLSTAKDCLYNEIDDEVVILSIKKGAYYNLSKTGSDIWVFLQTPHSFDQIVNYLCSKYEVDIEQCKQETIEYLEQLLDDGLIQLSDEETNQ